MGFTSIPVHGAEKHIDVTRELFIPAYGGLTDGTLANLGYYCVVNLLDGVYDDIHVTFKIPNDWVSLSSLRVILATTVAVGDFVWDLGSSQAAEGEAYNTHGGTDLANVATVPATANQIFLVHVFGTVIRDASKGDYVALWFARDGGDANDTLAASLSVLGFLLTYTAEQ